MLNGELTAALERAADGQPYVPDAINALARAKTLRRRHFRVALTAVVSLFVGVAAAGIAVALSNDDVQTVSATGGPATVLATVDGIDVTWLPAGYRADNSMLRADDAQLSFGAVGVYQEFRPATGASEQVFVPPGLSLTVERSSNYDFRAASNDSIASATGYETSWSTVRGHRALLLTNPANKVRGPAAYRLLWDEQPGLAVEVDAFGGVTLRDAQRMASSLVVGVPAESSAATSAAVAQIRRAFQTAYTARTPPTSPSEALGAVERGSELAGTLRQLNEKLPETVRTSRITVGNIRFLSASSALVGVDLYYSWMGQQTHNGIPQIAKLVAGTWKVSEASFCAAIGGGGVTCPPGVPKS
jgi:hypothetical protein